MLVQKLKTDIASSSLSEVNKVVRCCTKPIKQRVAEIVDDATNWQKF